MYKIENMKAERVEPVTFSAIEIKESEIEEILRRNIDMICDDEESMIIVGQQVKNENNGRSDLTAIDNEGNIVLIEIKRDPRDIENRKEAFEFQAVRYAASYATIRDIESLVRKVYGPYIEKHREEFGQMDLTSYELGLRRINEFLRANDAEKSFNKRQRIILAASDFDEQTLSAVAWLNSNGVDVSCYRLIPYKLDDKTYIRAERILPVVSSPGGFHPQALSEPDLNLLIHPAPIIQPYRISPLSSVQRRCHTTSFCLLALPSPLFTVPP
ncbi:hypothetical protein, partial [Mesotoga sp. B105.6.4]|uniref:hypothetical protein n=1 Tax=Mesotoga sp. B105.6.4 TaxID=1582224 RepID=UPI000CCC0B39